MNNQKSVCCGGRILHNNQCEICGSNSSFKNNKKEMQEMFPNLEDNELCYFDEDKGIVGKPIQNETNIAHNLMNKLLFGKDTSKYYPDQKGKRLHL